MADASDTELIDAIVKHKLAVSFDERAPHYISVWDSPTGNSYVNDEDKITDWRDAVMFALNEIELEEAEQSGS